MITYCPLRRVSGGRDILTSYASQRKFFASMRPEFALGPLVNNPVLVGQPRKPSIARRNFSEHYNGAHWRLPYEGAFVTAGN